MELEVMRETQQKIQNLKKNLSVTSKGVTFFFSPSRLCSVTWLRFPAFPLTVTVFFFHSNHRLATYFQPKLYNLVFGE